jgi:hypothetical protein
LLPREIHCQPRGNNLLYHPLSYALFVLLYWMFFSPGFILCHINYFTLSHHFASDVSFGIIKHLLTRYSGNSKFIKLLTFHLPNLKKQYTRYMYIPWWFFLPLQQLQYLILQWHLFFYDFSNMTCLFLTIIANYTCTHHRYHSLTHLKITAIEIQGIKIIKKNETRRKEHGIRRGWQWNF